METVDALTHGVVEFHREHFKSAPQLKRDSLGRSRIGLFLTESIEQAGRQRLLANLLDATLFVARQLCN